MSAALKIGGLALVLLLAACSEKSQALGGPARKADPAAWGPSEGAKPGFAAAGWKGGDKAAWEAQIRMRNQAQNDYAR
ncbi:MAG: hypothetical protein H7306_23550 [Bacteriovorax sp.]|nr:hypothetical protein [Rhizobacter sp.]